MKKNFIYHIFVFFIVFIALFGLTTSIFASGVPEEKVKPDTGEFPQYSSFIIVRLSAQLPSVPDYCQTLDEAARTLDLFELSAILDEYQLFITSRLIRSLDPQKILYLENIAMKSELRPLHSLTRYWRIDARNQEKNIDNIVERLNSLEGIDQAYKEYIVTDPVVNPADDPYNSSQDYLDAAPVGIDARWAWTQPNCEGAGIGFVDMEQGWFPNHEDFLSKSPTIIYGDNMDGVGSYKGNHGTAVLGEVIADDNTDGVVGIAPSVSYVAMTSHYNAVTHTNLNVADAIVAAIPAMNVGDVLLLEVQRSYRPTEIDTADFDAIRLAVSYGIIVVEASGNGNTDLDAYTNTSGDTVLNRTSPDFLDSGAIMIGAAESALPHDRAWFSNYGSRIDCYGWGENVVSCGYGDLDAGTGDNSTYTDSFSGTSSASPIIAGAALILQGLYEANTGNRLSPLQMRTILSDPATGTAQGGGVAGDIGVMPDLRDIIQTTYEQIPDVYLRDYAADSGAVPTTGGISASPDIITRPATVANPQTAFGTGSGTENSNTLGDEAIAGQDNYIYVRMKNRGNADANNVTATIYWSPVSTLVTPDLWNLVGTASPLNVPQGGNLWVTQPLTWASSDIPATGHYCYVGILDHPQDPAPPLPSATDWNGFYNLIRNYNNITWRNFNVVNPEDGDPAIMPFLIPGAPDESRFFDLEIIQNLDKNARVWLEADMELGQQILKRFDFPDYVIDRVRQIVILLLSPEESHINLPELYFYKKARFNARFVVKGSKNYVQSGDWITIRHIYKKTEVGRVTWQFQRKEDNNPFVKE